MLGQILGAGASIFGGLMGKSAAEDAAEAQQAAAMMQLAEERKVRNQTRKDLKPWYSSGKNAQKALEYELGLRSRPTFGGSRPKVETITGATGATATGAPGQETWTPDGAPWPGSDADIRSKQEMAPNAGWRDVQNPSAQGGQAPTQYRVGDRVFNSLAEAQAYADSQATEGTPYRGFEATPSYDFRMSQGLDAIDNSAASRGNVFSGATMKAAQQFGEGLAASEYDNYLRRLSGMAAGGQNAAAGYANAGANYAAGAGQAYGNYGNAASAGIIGGQNALMGGINNAIGLWNYQNNLGNTGTTQAQANNMLNQNSIFNTQSMFG